MFQNKNGMALVEMTTVIAIIALISIFAVPQFINKQKLAETIEVKNDIRKLEELFASMTDEEMLKITETSLENEEFVLEVIFTQNLKLKEKLKKYDIKNLKFIGNDFYKDLNYINSFNKDLRNYFVYFNKENLQDRDNRKVFYMGADVVDDKDNLIVTIEDN